MAYMKTVSCTEQDVKMTRSRRFSHRCSKNLTSATSLFYVLSGPWNQCHITVWSTLWLGLCLVYCSMNIPSSPSPLHLPFLRASKMENLHHSPYVYGLTTRLENPRAQSPYRRLTIYIDNFVQWESSICSSEYSWRVDTPIHFAASSNIIIKLSSPDPSLVVDSGTSTQLGSFSGRVIELLDGHSVHIGIEGKVHCLVQLAPVYRIDMPTHDNFSRGIMHSLHKAAECILTADKTQWSGVHRKIVDSCQIVVSESQDEAHDSRIIDLAECLCKLYKAVPSQSNAFVKAVAREAVQIASLIDKYERLPEKDDMNQDMGEYYEIVRARCEILMKGLDTG
ncbi:hypothetical protein HETIRDRAFT_170089 [Heterobasidion irregulare TC 32-1]|uniref:Uncharacterized protein n=1 Tax=Heterobasidion irregulare (strain TC 32-1) TaxID=747525 RepID=W4KE92_HETIT|nr:uncharacterized protein HETIRDRAFT_170089 [Heterobasidion irregulare TC 32-1]ETW83640.1 hypothetical protein HETIRDRAFT_170089 [Heterobasidion irregulare TC 32-1]